MSVSRLHHLLSKQSPRLRSQTVRLPFCARAAVWRWQDVWRVIFSGWLLSLSGCGSWLPEMVPFGSVTAPDVNRSLNGLGLHRKMWETSGAKCLTPRRLSPKLDDMDVIVLVGQSYAPPGLLARRWLEDWLAEETGRTVIYFGRDFNADIYYRQQTLSQLAGDDRRRGEVLLAQQQAAELNARLQQLAAPVFCGWFYLDTQLPLAEYRHFRGPWADEDPSIGSARGSWPVRISLQPPDDDRWLANKPPWLTKPAPANPLRGLSGFNSEERGVNQLSRWDAQELDTVQLWEEEVERVPESQVMLASSDGRALVMRLTSERFSGSQILIVANGAPFLNASLVVPLQQRIGERLIDACLPARRVALLAYDESGLSISYAEEKNNRAAGLEMLTVWPLSGITMPAALLGIIVCVTLWPILGRPQSLVRRSVSDFGLHIDALGRMLHEARDVKHAQRAIGEYFRKVRGETPPDWLDSIDLSD